MSCTHLQLWYNGSHGQYALHLHSSIYSEIIGGRLENEWKVDSYHFFFQFLFNVNSILSSSNQYQLLSTQLWNALININVNFNCANFSLSIVSYQCIEHLCTLYRLVGTRYFQVPCTCSPVQGTFEYLVPTPRYKVLLRTLYLPPGTSLCTGSGTNRYMVKYIFFLFFCFVIMAMLGRLI